MSEKFTSRIRKSVCVGLCSVIVFSAFTQTGDLTPKNMSLFFPQITLGGSIKRDSENTDEDSKIVVAQKEERPQFSFKIVELFESWFD